MCGCPLKLCADPTYLASARILHHVTFAHILGTSFILFTRLPLICQQAKLQLAKSPKGFKFRPFAWLAATQNRFW